MAEEFTNLLIEGTHLLQKGQTRLAAEVLKKANDLAPDNFDAAFNLSGAYILMGSFKKAIPILELLVERYEGNASVHTNLGAAYLGNPVLSRNEDQKKAIEAFKLALNIDPHAPNVAYNIGLIYRDRKDLTEAQIWFEKALESNPRDRDAQSQINKIKNLRE